MFILYHFCPFQLTGGGAELRCALIHYHIRESCIFFSYFVYINVLVLRSMMYEGVCVSLSGSTMLALSKIWDMIPYLLAWVLGPH